MSVAGMERLAGYALAGLVLGVASFATLRVNTALYLSGSLWRPIALHAARLGVLGVALVAAAHQGAGPLLAGAGGLVAARFIAVAPKGRLP